MSLIGTERTCSLKKRMSVAGGRTDVIGNRRHFRATQLGHQPSRTSIQKGTSRPVPSKLPLVGSSRTT